MRNHLALTAFGALALVAGTSAAPAQTAVVPGPPATIVTQAPTTVVTEPAAPVETVETVRTVRSTTIPAHRIAGRSVAPHRSARVTTTRTVVRETRMPVTPALAAITQPTYTEVVPAPVLPAPAVSASTYPAPLYDVVTAPDFVAPATVAQPVAGAAVTPPAYRYVYEPDRILVIDPYTNIAVQSIPR
jgi:hypothetical protein